MAPVLIKTLSIAKHYGTKHTLVRALEDIDLSVRQGEFVAIMGPSGSGKSTLMNILGLLDHPTEGQYIFGGEHVGSLSHDMLAENRNRNVGFVFQGFNLLARATALENVSLPLVYRGLRRAERARCAQAALESVGLGPRIHHKPPKLSGGEQQRVAIARAIVGNPLLLLADEPTGSLDTDTGREILDLFRQLNRSGCTVILITHDSEVALCAERVISLRNGRVIGDQQLDASKIDGLLGVPV